MTGRWGKWAPRTEIRLKGLKLEFVFILAAETIQNGLGPLCIWQCLFYGLNRMVIVGMPHFSLRLGLVTWCQAEVSLDMKRVCLAKCRCYIV